MITTNPISSMTLIHIDGDLYRFDADVIVERFDGSSQTVRRIHREGLPFEAASEEAAEGRRAERADLLMFDVLCLLKGTL